MGSLLTGFQNGVWMLKDTIHFHYTLISKKQPACASVGSVAPEGGKWKICKLHQPVLMHRTAPCPAGCRGMARFDLQF
jgi:hypothetical protein